MTDDELDHRPMTKGKYGPNGGRLTADQVARRDPGYIVWAYEAWGLGECCSALLYRECAKDVAESRRQGRVSKDQDD